MGILHIKRASILGSAARLGAKGVAKVAPSAIKHQVSGNPMVGMAMGLTGTTPASRRLADQHGALKATHQASTAQRSGVGVNDANVNRAEGEEKTASIDGVVLDVPHDTAHLYEALLKESVLFEKRADWRASGREAGRNAGSSIKGSLKGGAQHGLMTKGMEVLSGEHRANYDAKKALQMTDKLKAGAGAASVGILGGGLAAAMVHKRHKNAVRRGEAETSSTVNKVAGMMGDAGRKALSITGQAVGKVGRAAGAAAGTAATHTLNNSVERLGKSTGTAIADVGEHALKRGVARVTGAPGAPGGPMVPPAPIKKGLLGMGKKAGVVSYVGKGMGNLAGKAGASAAGAAGRHIGNAAGQMAASKSIDLAAGAGRKLEARRALIDRKKTVRAAGGAGLAAGGVIAAGAGLLAAKDSMAAKRTRMERLRQRHAGGDNQNKEASMASFKSSLANAAPHLALGGASLGLGAIIDGRARKQQARDRMREVLIGTGLTALAPALVAGGVYAASKYKDKKNLSKSYEQLPKHLKSKDSLKHYNYIKHMSPHVASDPYALESEMERMRQMGNTSTEHAKSLGQIEGSSASRPKRYEEELISGLGRAPGDIYTKTRAEPRENQFSSMLRTHGQSQILGSFSNSKPKPNSRGKR